MRGMPEMEMSRNPERWSERYVEFAVRDIRCNDFFGNEYPDGALMCYGAPVVHCKFS